MVRAGYGGTMMGRQRNKVGRPWSRRHGQEKHHEPVMVESESGDWQSFLTVLLPKEAAADLFPGAGGGRPGRSLIYKSR